MGKRIEIEDLSALKKVHEVMVSLSLPNLNADALSSVGKIERDDFKKAIVRIANNEDQMNEYRDYINSVTCLLSGTVEGALASLGYANIPKDTLIIIGKECGKEFRSKLSAAVGNDMESIQWIQRKMTAFVGGSSDLTQPSKQGNQPQRVNNPTPSNQHQNGSLNPVANASSQSRPQQNSNQNNVQNINQRRPQSNEQLDRNDRRRPEVGQGDNENKNREFFSETFYGTKSALCFNAVEKDGEYSINLDGGNKKPNQPEGGRAIDWQDKVVFGFSPDELIEFAWVLMGLSVSCEFSGHGPLHDKSFQFKRQDTGFFGSVSAKDKGSRAVPLGFAAGARLMFMVTQQIQKNYPNMTTSEVLGMLKMMAKPQKKAVNG